MRDTSENFGFIKADELYTLHEFKRRLGLNDAALRAARRKGLHVYRVHGRGFILGRDGIDYVTQTSGRDATGDGHE
jgi:hypothetical protein